MRRQLQVSWSGRRSLKQIAKKLGTGGETLSAERREDELKAQFDLLYAALRRQLESRCSDECWRNDGKKYWAVMSDAGSSLGRAYHKRRFQSQGKVRAIRVLREVLVDVQSFLENDKYMDEMKPEFKRNNAWVEREIERLESMESV